MTVTQPRPARGLRQTRATRLRHALRHALRRGWAAFAALLLVATGGAAAFAYWQASSTAPDGLAVADTLQQGPTPSARATQASVALAWTASTTAGGRAVSGYTVRRYGAATGGAPVQATGGCAGVVTTGSCTESAVPNGTWYYAVTPLLGNWSGAESARSGAALADASAPTVSASVSPTPNAAGYNSTTPVVVTLTAQDNAGGSGVASLTYSLDAGQPVTVAGTSASVPVAGDGGHKLTYSATDVAGNASVSQSLTIRIDTQAPGTPSLVVPTYINAASAGGTVSVSGTAEAGSTVTLAPSDGAGHTMAPATATAQSNGSWTVTNLNLSGLADGTVTFTATAQDAAGNVSPAATATSTKDTKAPTGTTITQPSTVTSANVASMSVGGTAEPGAAISLSVSDAGAVHTVPGTATADASGAWSVTALNLASLSDGPLTYTAGAIDRAGNSGAAVTAAGTKKATTTTPSFTAGTGQIPSSKTSSWTISGTAEAGVSLVIMVTDSANKTVTINTSSPAGIWTAQANLSALASGALTLSAKATDAYGNSSIGTAPGRILPGVTSVQLTNGGGNPGSGKAAQGDKVTITFSGPMNPSSLCGLTQTGSLWSANVTARISTIVASPNPLDTLDITSGCGSPFGAVPLGANYAKSNGSGAGPLVFAATLQLNATETTLTITLGTLNSGQANNNVSAGKPGFIPDSTTPPRDVDGYGVAEQFTDGAATGF